MQARVHHQPRGPEHLRLQPSQVSQRVALIQTHVGLGDALGIQGPSFGVCGEIGHLPHQRNAPNGQGGGRLEVVTRRAFVDHEAGQGPSRVVGRVLEVDVETPRPRTVQGGAVVVAPRAAVLLVFGHPHDFQRVRRDGLEVPRRCLHHPLMDGIQVRDHRGAAFLGVWKDLAGLAVQVGDALRQALLGLANSLRVEDGHHLRLQTSHFLEAQSMDLLGGQARGGVRGQGCRVDLASLWDAVYAGPRVGLLEQGFVQGDELAVAGHDAPLQDVLGPLAELGCLCRTNAAYRLEPFLQARHQYMLGGWGCHKGPQLFQHAPHDEVRWHHTMVSVLLHPLVGLLQDVGEGLHPLQVALGTFEAADGVHIREELGQLHGHPVELREPIAAALKLRLRDLVVHHPGGDLPGQPFLAFQPFRSVAV